MKSSWTHGAQDREDLSEVFHEATKERGPLRTLPRIGREDAKRIMSWQRQDMLFPQLDLSACQDVPLPLALGEAFARRRSARTFHPERPLPFGRLVALLKSACGVGRTESDGLTYRTWPSAGGLFPIDIFVSMQNVQDTPQVLARYNPLAHRLTVHGDASHTTALASALHAAPSWAADAGALLVLVGQFWKSKHKYGTRGYRYCLLDAGHLGQNVCLAATALEMSACPVGSFDETIIERALSLDGVDESPIHVIALGTGSSA